ncbi:hypothetical protein KCU59_g87, partial [Aureobasidium melanogenum]
MHNLFYLVVMSEVGSAARNASSCRYLEGFAPLSNVAEKNQYLIAIETSRLTFDDSLVRNDRCNRTRCPA